MRHGLAGLAILVACGVFASASAEPPRTGRDLMLQMATQAERNAEHATKTADAKTWRAWALIYRKEAVLPQAEQMSARDLVRQAEQNNAAAMRKAEADGQSVAAAFWRASYGLWADLDNQLSHGGPLAIHFPERAMLTPVPGLPDTPWGQSGLKVTASDCAVIARRVQFCQAQFSQMQHDQMTGLYGDQGTPMVMKLHECNRWREMQAAYCMK